MLGDDLANALNKDGTNEDVPYPRLARLVLDLLGVT
jgi:hypothetical protein